MDHEVAWSLAMQEICNKKIYCTHVNLCGTHKLMWEDTFCSCIQTPFHSKSLRLALIENYARIEILVRHAFFT